MSAVEARAPAQPAAEPASRSQRQPTLTVTLLLVTVAAVVAVATTSASRVRENYEPRLLTMSSFTVATIAGRYLAPASPLLTEARYRAERSLAWVDDPDALTEYLIDRVRFEPDVSFFYSGEQASGRFIGAWRRDDGAIILARSAPDVDDGRRTEWEITRPWERLPAGSVAVLINRAHTFTDLILPIDAAEARLFGGINGQRTIGAIRQAVGDRGDEPRARAFFQRLWGYDQVVFDASGAGS